MSSLQFFMSHSEIDTFLMCSRRHYYAHGEKLAPKRPSEALTTGINGHEVLEVFFKTLQATHDYDGSVGLARRLIEDQLRAGASMTSVAKISERLELFWEIYRERIESWEILHVEETFYVPVDDHMQFPFKPDLVIRENGMIVVVDYKFIGDFYKADDMALMPQFPKYIGGLRALGIQARHGLYIMFRTRANLKSTNPDDLIRLEVVKPTNARVQRTFYEQIQVTKGIVELKGLTLEEWERNVHRTSNKMVCSYCSFKDLCITELNGQSGQLMRETDFVPNTYGYEGPSGN